MPADKKIQNRRSAAYVEEVFRKIQEKPDIENIIVLNMKGNPIKTTMPMSEAVQYAGQYETLRDKVIMGLEKIDPTDEVTMIRVRTTFNETMIVPDGKITVMVIQKPEDRHYKG